MNQMLCGYRDDPRQWDEPEAIEEEDPLTDAEKRLEWLCDEWASAQTDDHYDTWRDIRMMVHGAMQALNYCTRDDRHDDRMALMTLVSLAFEYSLACIQQGKYEGAAA
jgi:hypothetical protein